MTSVGGARARAEIPQAFSCSYDAETLAAFEVQQSSTPITTGWEQQGRAVRHSVITGKSDDAASALLY